MEAKAEEKGNAVGEVEGERRRGKGKGKGNELRKGAMGGR